MPKTLPENATPASRRLYDLAVRLAESCPPELASEIALVGSAAMGLSDDQSDLDINFWADTIPPEAARVAWLESMGAKNVKVGTNRDDQSYPMAGVLDGVDVGCSWQTLTNLQFFTDLIVQGDIATYSDTRTRDTFAAVLVQAVPIRTNGVINEVQKRLEHYPNNMRELGMTWLLGKSGYHEELFKHMRKALRYGSEPDLIDEVALAVGNLVAALYPINRRYPPQSKWHYKLARDLPIQPPNLYERIGLALHDPDMRQRPLHLARLMLDTLALIQDEYDVSAAVNSIQAFLKENE